MGNALNIIPIGGLGEIGLNCMAIEYDDSLIIVDAGLIFPDADMPGVDLVIPDFSYLIENSHKIKAILLTHGHEDHIGALAFLLKEVTAPVYGSKLTLALASFRLKELKIQDDFLIAVSPRDKIQAGPFEIEFISVNHSIIDGLALAITTPEGILIHTGDFKIDQSAAFTGGDQTDLYTFASYGEKGVLALMSDSTNAESPGFTPGELEVGRSLKAIFREAKGRIFLACFASSLARIKQILNAADQTGRKVLFEGRSMINNVKLAIQLGYLGADLPLISPSEVDTFESSELVIACTGSQGEPSSALRRIALGEHKKFKIVSEDTVIISARSIPGNEKDIIQIVDLIYRSGGRVIDYKSGLVHSSGHAQAEELKMMINLVKPQYLIPIHGETRQLIKHGELAKSMGFDPERVIIAENGLKISFSNSDIEIGPKISTGRKLVDGKRLGEPEDPVLRSRLRMAGGGVVIFSLVLDKSNYSLLSEPLISTSGVYYENEFSLSKEIEESIKESLSFWRNNLDISLNNSDEKHSESVDTNLEDEQEKFTANQLEELSNLLVKNIRQLFRQSISSRPVIYPQIITV